jgi:hypothetical protein
VDFWWTELRLLFLPKTLRISSYSYLTCLMNRSFKVLLKDFLLRILIICVLWAPCTQRSVDSHYVAVTLVASVDVCYCPSDTYFVQICINLY